MRLSLLGGPRRSRRERATRPAARNRARFVVQELESRELKTVGLALDSASKVLTINGSTANDVVHVDYAPVVSGNPTTINVHLQFDSGSETDASYATSAVTSIVYNGQGGTTSS